MAENSLFQTFGFLVNIKPFMTEPYQVCSRKSTTSKYMGVRSLRKSGGDLNVYGRKVIKKCNACRAKAVTEGPSMLGAYLPENLGFYFDFDAFW